MPASNSVEITSSSSASKSLGLVGRYVYICYKVPKDKTAAFHFDFIMQDKNSCRLTLTTLTTGVKEKRESNPMLPLEATGRWTIHCVDLDYAFMELKAYPKTNLIRKYKFELTAITLCAESYVRGIYTSDNLYNLQVMPKEINFRRPQQGTWEENYAIKYYPVMLSKESLKYVEQI